MVTIRIRFILVALVVSFFAIGMAAFLNYFKYKSTFSEIVESRLLVVGRGIESSVQASLQVGLQFTELGTLQPLMEREKASDSLIRSIDVFDTSGQVIYSTDSRHIKQEVPDAWVRAAERSKTTEWSAEELDEFVAGISLKNNFDLTVGYLALRYSREYVEESAARVRRELLLAALGAFGISALFAPLLLVAVVRRFERDLGVVEAAVSHLEDRQAPRPVSVAAASDFDPVIASLRDSLDGANLALDDVRAKLDAVT